MVGRQATLQGQAVLCILSVLCRLCRSGLLVIDTCWAQANPSALCCRFAAQLSPALAKWPAATWTQSGWRLQWRAPVHLCLAWQWAASWVVALRPLSRLD